jgi:hypothetical protein
VLCAFDLIALDGKGHAAGSQSRSVNTPWLMCCSGEWDGIPFNQYYDGDGASVFKQVFALGCKGIVSKRLGPPHRSGRTDQWLKVKNLPAPAVKHESRAMLMAARSFPGFGSVAYGRWRERARIWLGRVEADFACNAMDLGLAPFFFRLSFLSMGRRRNAKHRHAGEVLHAPRTRPPQL